MRAAEAAALAVLIAVLASAAVASYSQQASYSRRLLVTAVAVPQEPAQPLGQLAQVLGELERLSTMVRVTSLSELSSANASYVYVAVRYVAEQAYSSPELRSSGLAAAASAVEEMMGDAREAYDLLYRAQQLEAAGYYGAAAALANESLDYVARAASILGALESAYLPAVESLAGPSYVGALESLANETRLVLALIGAADEAILRQAAPNVTGLAGVAYVSLSVSPAVATYGGPLEVSGRALLNLTRPLAGAAVRIYVGGSSIEAVTNFTGYFSVTLAAPFNSSGVLCVEAEVVPPGPGVVPVLASECVRLNYTDTRLSVEPLGARVLPGGEAALAVNVSPPYCAPLGVTVIVDGSAENFALASPSGVVEVPVPPDAPTGPLEVNVSVIPRPPCAPASAVAYVDVARLPTSVEVSAPPVWLGALPLPVRYAASAPGLVELRAGPYSANASSSGSWALLWAPSLLGGEVVVSATLVPVNYTLAESSATASVYEAPGLSLVALAVAAVAGYAAARRGPRPGALPSPPPRPAGPSDPLVARAWDVLERAAMEAGAVVAASSTMRELASGVAAARPWLAGLLDRAVSLAERAAYGGGLDEAGRAELARALDELVRSLWGR